MKNIAPAGEQPRPRSKVRGLQRVLHHVVGDLRLNGRGGVDAELVVNAAVDPGIADVSDQLAVAGVLERGDRLAGLRVVQVQLTSAPPGMASVP